MKSILSESYKLHPDVRFALTRRKAVVALESTVITHGLPRPENLLLARELETIVRRHGATPATIAMLSGKISIGLFDEELDLLAASDSAVKISLRNIGIGIAKGFTGGTTVAATLALANNAGIKVFGTGGIGGVHRGNPFDISADLEALSQTPIVVVCAGAKAILDLPATLEALETRGIPVIGYQTNEFPAFYSRTSGLPVDCRVENAKEIFEIAQAHWSVGNRSGVLVCNPIPEADALDASEVDRVVQQAIVEAGLTGISGAALTPFLLAKVSSATGGKSLHANLALIKNNAALAADISILFSGQDLVTF